jgi:hypothetical protein
MTVISKNIYHKTTDGFDFSSFAFGLNIEQVTINHHIKVTSVHAFGVYSNDSTNADVLDNHGRIFSHLSDAVFFDKQTTNGFIFNESDGTILGGNIGVYVEGNNEEIENFGVINNSYNISGTGVLFGLTSNHVSLYNENRASIFGFINGVKANSEHDGGTIFNAGHIVSTSAGVAIEVNTGKGLVTSITNTATGLISTYGLYIPFPIISGPHIAIETKDNGAIRLNNRGTIDGQYRLEGCRRTRRHYQSWQDQWQSLSPQRQ